MNNSKFDLTFPMLEYGTSETPWDLQPWLFLGGAGAKVKYVHQQISRGDLGSPLLERLELVKRLHEHITDDLIGGGSRFSALNKIQALRKLFAWVDLENVHFSLDTAASIFIRWTNHLLQCHKNRPNFSDGSLYDLTRLTATMLDRVLNRQASLSKSTRIRKPRNKAKVQTSKADKQNLQITFTFGHVLADICETLTWERIMAPLPVCVSLHSGQVLELWSGYLNPKKAAMRNTKPKSQVQINASLVARNAHDEDRTLQTRFPIVNLRIECELLMSISQTGLNLQQAHTLRIDQFHYTSHLDGYQVRTYKKRRGGEVLFEIFTSYREWFERYIKWRSEWFSDESDSLLFPLIRNRGRILEKAPQFTNIRRICREYSIPMVSPKTLRGTRINWLLRMGHNPEQVAELAQHTVQTLMHVYTNPHPQIAMVEITRFHQQSDLSLASPGPGRCVLTTPVPMDTIPKNAPRPDCINAAGCLFCVQHRDIESEDHVWSLSSLRYLKSLELARYSPSNSNQYLVTNHPALLVIEQLTAKLNFFEKYSETGKLWVEESKARINEGDYHPAWDGFIRLAEFGKKSL